MKQDLLKAIKESAENTTRNILVKVDKSIKESAEKTTQNLLVKIKESAKETEQNLLVKIKESAKETERNILVKVDEMLEKRIDGVLSAVNEFSNRVDERFEKNEADIESLKSGVESLKSDVTEVRSKMVTKEYLDDKLADLKGELVVAVRKEDDKTNLIVNTLRDEDVFSEQQQKEILAIKPFAKDTV